MADKTVGLDVLPGGAGGLQVKYHDNGDGTFSQQVYTTGSGGGGGGAVTMATGAVASGAYAAGSIAAGAVVAGAMVDGADVTQGLTTDAVVAAGAAGTLSAKLRAVSRDIGTVAANLPAKGQATSANSTPVVIASDQSAVPVSLGTIKAASTPAVAADTALVVAVSPNNAVGLLDSAGTNKATIKAAATAAAASTDTSLVVQSLLGSALAQAGIAISGSTTQGAALTLLAVQATQSELSSVSMSAASGTSSVVTPSNGISSQFTLNISAWSAGSSTGFDAILQYSLDGQATWIDAWHFDRVTATGTQVTPPLNIGGYSRRITWVNNTGAATTTTVSLLATRMPTPVGPAFKYIDRTASLITNPAANATGSTFRVLGAKAITAAITVGTAATPGVYAIQTSADGTNWSTAVNAAGTAASVTAVANSTVQVTAVNVTHSYVRMIQTASSVSQTGTQITITALG